jgi:hypothetical protein
MMRDAKSPHGRRRDDRRTRVAFVRGLLLVLPAAGCSPAAYPSGITVLGYGAPRDGAPGGFVVVYDPHGHHTPPLAERSDVEVLRPLSDVRVTCTNTPCSGGNAQVTLAEPAAGIRRVELLVEKDGFEPERVTVPFDGLPYPKVLVVMKPVAK